MKKTLPILFLGLSLTLSCVKESFHHSDLEKSASNREELIESLDALANITTPVILANHELHHQGQPLDFALTQQIYNETDWSGVAKFQSTYSQAQLKFDDWLNANSAHHSSASLETLSLDFLRYYKGSIDDTEERTLSSNVASMGTPCYDRYERDIRDAAVAVGLGLVSTGGNLGLGFICLAGGAVMADNAHGAYEECLGNNYP